VCNQCSNEIANRVDVLIREAEEEVSSYSLLLSDLHCLFPWPCAVSDQRGRFEEAVQSLRFMHEELRIDRDTVCREEGELQQEEERFWSDFMTKSQQVEYFQSNAEFQPKSQVETLSDELALLRLVNVYSDTFSIGITPHGIGTINNLRLGRKPEEVVEWEEINAAWGQSVLLLHILAKKLGFTFSKYRLIPTGVRPFIQQKDQHGGGLGLTYPLHGSQAITFSRSAYFYEFWGSTNNISTFDLGMEAFLFCVSELCARAISLSSTIALPYYIDKDKIGTKQGLKSIKTIANNEADWSKALKYMLTNLKRILVCLPSIVAHNHAIHL